MKKVFITVLLAVSVILLTPSLVCAQDTSKLYEAKVTQISGKTTRVLFTNGPLKGKTFSINTDTVQTTQKIEYKTGDDVVISYNQSPGGARLYIVDYVRRTQLLFLALLFLFAVVYIGRWQGVRSFVGMLVSFAVIGNFIIPQILLGNDPVLITLIGALFMTPVIFYLGHGVNKKTTIALIGTFVSLILTGVLAYLFVYIAHLTGFAAEESSYLQLVKGGTVNIRSLLLAGIIIGALGVLDDTTISQTSLVAKLKETNKNFKTAELYKHSMEVGRDHIASLVNTLILVYAGASLPLFLLFYNSQEAFGTVINHEIIATEIVRTLVASIGIILAVPITTYVACLFHKD